MNPFEFLARLAIGLDAAGIDYMVAGSVASSVFGEPRATNDLDVVVKITAQQVRDLQQALPAELCYFDSDTARDAILRQSQFNVIDIQTGWKADLIALKARPFSREEFARRIQVSLDGHRVWMATPEDIVISKLEWATKTGSDRQLRTFAAYWNARPRSSIWTMSRSGSPNSACRRPGRSSERPNGAKTGHITRACYCERSLRSLVGSAALTAETQFKSSHIRRSRATSGAPKPRWVASSGRNPPRDCCVYCT